MTWSSPPREATTTRVDPCWIGEVSSTVCSRPDLRPVVVSSRTGIFPAVQPSLPKLTASITRCAAFMDFRRQIARHTANLRYADPAETSA